jgi:hypothetical protein
MADESALDSGTVLSINGEAGADYAWSVEGVTDGAGRVSAQIDLGAAPRINWILSWSCEVQWQATPDQGGTLELYYATAPDSDSTQITADVGASDAALGDTDMTKNLNYFGAVVSENATASEKCVANGTLIIYDRYLTLACVNNGGATINATDSNFQMKLTPKNLEPGA